ncbi:vWA domain-containing protein [Corynebacterium variabile]|uniref:von Willebrand factor type A domain n=2 Tax=Corynebacterium variabile TaxID=1727 RepID=A0A0X2NMA2_9CORY|nr:vWA domain-containing protein [Corynebacterium variabile]CUU66615.1 von Willebrand factor type A domain [Corynebacterium variabile]
MTSTSPRRNRRNRATRLAAALGSGALLAGAALVGAPAALAQDAPQDTPQGTGISPDGQESINELGSCIAATKSADILLILDQSASLKGFDGKPPTDPDNIRVDATRDLVKQLGTHAEDLGANINVKLAGFGEGYHNATGDYGDWVSVGAHSGDLDKAIDGFGGRNTDMYTNYEDALAGASREFAGAPTTDGRASDCQAVLFFSDGKVTHPDKTNEQAVADVCRPDSPLVSLRNSGVRFFTVGLIPEDEVDSPRELLTEMAEGPCGGGDPNGAYFDAGTDPAGLLAAFRGFIPTANSVDATPSMSEPQRFTLDNSIDSVRLSAQPTTSIDGQVTPVLTAPGGERVELTADTTEVGGADVTVETTDVVNGMVDAELTLPEGGDWAGEWTFGYDAPTAPDDWYKVKVTLVPGLAVKVDELSEGAATGLKSDGQLHASLVDASGEPRRLDGEAELTAEFVNGAGETVDLGTQSAKDGTPVAFDLAPVQEAASGEINLRAVITTRAAGDAPGTRLSPLSITYPVTITPVNMPTLGTPGALDIDAEETTVEIPVSGPGRVWVDPTTMASGDEGVVLPDGVGSVEVSSEYSGADNALELGADEQGTLPVTVTSPDLADGRVAVTPQVHLVSDDGASETDVALPLKGNMSAPVNTGVFIGALIGVLLAAILIPLAVLYLMKLYTGRIPSSPGIHAVRIPVKVENGRLLRTDKGGNFQVSYEEITGAGRTVASGRDVNLAGVPVHVKLGANPLAAPYAVVDAPAPSISDEGRQAGTAARLPLAVHNHWVMLGTPGDPTTGEVVLAVDEFSTEGRVNDLTAAIAANGPELRERLAATPVETPGQGGKPRRKGDPAAAPVNPADPATAPADQSWPGSGFGPATGGPTPFGGPAGNTGSSGAPGTSGGTWGSDPGNGSGPSPFGGPGTPGGPRPFGS